MSDLAAMVLAYGVSAAVSVALVGGFLLLRASRETGERGRAGSPPSARLYQIAGLLEAPAYEVRRGGLEVACDPDTWDALRVAATMIARGGVALSPEWWAMQSPLERAVLVDAQDRLWAERAVAIGTATLGRTEAAHVLSRSDGGAAAVRTELAEAAIRGAREAAGRDVTQ